MFEKMTSQYKEAKTVKEKVMCFIAKALGAKYVTPLGRIVLLPSDYEKAENRLGNNDAKESDERSGKYGRK